MNFKVRGGREPPASVNCPTNLSDPPLRVRLPPMRAKEKKKRHLGHSKTPVNIGGNNCVMGGSWVTPTL